MKLRLVFDSETTGKNDFKAHYTAKHQPDLVMLCGLLMDETEKRRGSFELIIKPDGWVIEPAAAAVHGITQEIAMQFGVGRRVALAVFSNFCKLADELIAHNADFDEMIIRTASHREGVKHRLDEKPIRCTKEMGVPVCRLRPNFPGADFKWPTLTELHTFLFGKPFEGAHNPLDDCLATSACFFEMMRNHRETLMERFAWAAEPIPAAPKPVPLADTANSPELFA